MNTIRSLVAFYAENSSDSFQGYEGLYFEKNDKTFRLDSSLKLIPIKKEKNGKLTVGLLDKVTNCVRDFFGNPRFDKDAIKSALLDKARNEGSLQLLEDSRLWADLTQPVYNGL